MAKDFLGVQGLRLPLPPRRAQIPSLVGEAKNMPWGQKKKNWLERGRKQLYSYDSLRGEYYKQNPVQSKLQTLLVVHPTNIIPAFSFLVLAIWVHLLATGVWKMVISPGLSWWVVYFLMRWTHLWVGNGPKAKQDLMFRKMRVLPWFWVIYSWVCDLL